MEQEHQRDQHDKKRVEPTTREMNTALFILRGLQVGLRLEDFDTLEAGAVFDLLAESSNDSYEYPKQGTDEDFKTFFGR